MSLVQFHRYCLLYIIRYYTSIYELDNVNGTLSIKFLFLFLLFTVFDPTGRMIIGLPFAFSIHLLIEFFAVPFSFVFFSLSIIIKYENPFKVVYDFCVVNVFDPPSPVQQQKKNPLSNHNQIKLSNIVFAFLLSLIQTVCYFVGLLV